MAEECTDYGWQFGHVGMMLQEQHETHQIHEYTQSHQHVSLSQDLVNLPSPKVNILTIPGFSVGTATPCTARSATYL